MPRAPRDRATRNREIPLRRRDQVSTVDLSHDDVDAGVDGYDVGKQMAFDHLWDGGEVHERWWTDAPAHGLGGAVRYHIVALLALRAFHRDIRLADRRARTLHHHLEMVDHRFHLARRLRL